VILTQTRLKRVAINLSRNVKSGGILARDVQFVFK